MDIGGRGGGTGTERGDSPGEGVRGVVGDKATHFLIRGFVTGNLDGLDDAKHGDPDQLQGCPEGEQYGEAVSGEQVAKRG